MKQIALFETEEQRPRATIRRQPRPRQTRQIHGLIQRGIDELQATRQADLIKRTHDLKFKKEETKNGDI